MATTKTPKLELPYLSASSASKEISWNESQNRLDALVQLTVVDYLNTPPGSPTPNVCYLVGASPTAGWSGHANQVAMYLSGAWVFHTPQEGFIAYDQTLNGFRHFNGSSWVAGLGTGSVPTLTAGAIPFGGAGGALTEDPTQLHWDNTQNFLGVGTNAPAGKLDIAMSSTQSGLMVRNTSNANKLMLQFTSLESDGRLLIRDFGEVPRVDIRGKGVLYVNDDTNTMQTMGLTINQAGYDDEILSLKSNDIAHGLTTLSEPDTYGAFLKATQLQGGLQVRGFTASILGLYLNAYTTTDEPAKLSFSEGAIVLESGLKSGTVVTSHGANANLLVVRNYTANRLIVDASGVVHSLGPTATDRLGNGFWAVNDTSNANMTLGLTINQGASDDEILSLKSSDVAHGMTTFTETDTFACLLKANATAGGLTLRGLSSGTNGLLLRGLHTTDDTLKTTAASAAVLISGGLKSGTSAVDLGANANILCIRNGTTARFIFDAEGESHQDVGVSWTNFSEHDDAGLLAALSAGVSPAHDPIRHQFAGFLEQHRQDLEALRLVTFNADGHHFVNWSRTHMLVIGAILQLTRRLEALEHRLALTT